MEKNLNSFEKKEHKPSSVVIDLMIENERNVFSMKLIFRSLGYLLITMLLNYIRKDYSLWIVWPLIIIQFSLYFSIFILCFSRVKVIGLNKYIAFFLLIVLTFIGRIENFEIIVIPLMMIIMLIVSYRNKRLSEESKLNLKNELKNENCKKSDSEVIDYDEIAKFVKSEYLNDEKEKT